MAKSIASTQDASTMSADGVLEQPEPDSPDLIQNIDKNNTNTQGEKKLGWFSRLFHGARGGNGGIRSELNDALQVSSEDNGDFTPGEKTMLRNILHLQNVRVEDLMIPRAEIEAVDIETSLGELLRIFEESGHSRLPVYGETLDDPRGMVHIRDLMAHITKTAGSVKKRSKSSHHVSDFSKVDLSKTLEKINLMRNILFVPPSMLATDLLARMQASRTQIALVIDEYGGTDGLVSLEDIVEEIVGEIEDEHDDDEELIIKKENGILRCDAKAEIEDLQEILNGNFNVGEHEEDAHSIGGVIFSLLGRVPVKGEVIDAFGYEIRIVDADPRRIKTVEMIPKRALARS